ncbi:MAG: amidohydrolase family protein [bacterium]
MIIDAHGHIGKFPPWPLARSEAEDIVDMLKEEKIDYVIASSAKSICYDCKEGNNEILLAAKKHKEILPLACVNPWYKKEAISELKSFTNKPYVGVKLHPSRHYYPICGSLAEPVLAMCEEMNIPILTHSAESDSTCNSNTLKKVLKKHRNLVLIAGHAGFSSFEMAELASKYKNFYLEISVNYEAGKLEHIIELAGADKILFGSDIPLHHPSVILQRLRKAKRSDNDEGKILYKNAERVFRLKLD